MLKTILFLALAASAFSVNQESEIIDKILSSFENRPVKELFKAWHLLFKKSYALDTSEAKSRFRIFKDNLKFIKEENAKNTGTIYGLNQFSDLTNDEYKKIYLDSTIGKKVRQLVREQQQNAILEGSWEATTQTDLRGVDKIDHTRGFGPARNQRHCGSCWAFATAATIEGAWGLQNNGTIQLSTQQLVDCDKKDYGCNGGWPDNAYNYVKEHGLTREANYPYTAKQRTCAKENITDTVNITGYTSCCPKTCGVNNTWFNILREGPALVVVDASSRNFQSYKGGVMPSAGCRKVNHAVTAIGYTPANGTVAAHYVVRNSWGESWGEKGHFRIAVANSTDCSGSCFVDRYAWRPNF